MRYAPPLMAMFMTVTNPATSQDYDRTFDSPFRTPEAIMCDMVALNEELFDGMYVEFTQGKFKVFSPHFFTGNGDGVSINLLDDILEYTKENFPNDTTQSRSSLPLARELASSLEALEDAQERQKLYPSCSEVIMSSGKLLGFIPKS
jgi:hypothetical protein